MVGSSLGTGKDGWYEGLAPAGGLPGPWLLPGTPQVRGRRPCPPWPAPCGNLAGLPRQRVTAGSLSRQHRPREWDSLRKAPPRGWNASAPQWGFGRQFHTVALHLPFNVGKDVGGRAQRGHGFGGDGEQLRNLGGGVQARQRGNSHREASRPSAGRWVICTSPGRHSSSTVFSSLRRRGFFAGWAGQAAFRRRRTGRYPAPGSSRTGGGHWAGR